MIVLTNFLLKSVAILTKDSLPTHSPSLAITNRMGLYTEAANGKEVVLQAQF